LPGFEYGGGDVHFHDVASPGMGVGLYSL